MSSRNKSGASQALTEDPADLRTPMAGSAKVAPRPRIKAKSRITGSTVFCGRRMPQVSPSGIRPRKSPSIKKANPSTTTPIPRATTNALAIGIFSTINWNNTR